MEGEVFGDRNVNVGVTQGFDGDWFVFAATVVDFFKGILVGSCHLYKLFLLNLFPCVKY